MSVLDAIKRVWTPQCEDSNIIIKQTFDNNYRMNVYVKTNKGDCVVQDNVMIESYFVQYDPVKDEVVKSYPPFLQGGSE